MLFRSSDLLWQKGPGNDARIIKYKFPHDGHYLIATQWYNKCLDQDTFFFTRITIETCTTTGLTELNRLEPKLIGVYDMMGRPVKALRRNEPLIYIYSDGTSKKTLIID